MTCYGQKSICLRKTPKNDLFEWQEIGIATLWEDLDIKLFTPGFLGFLGIKQFKIAIGKIGGIKIESAGGRNKFIC